MVRTTEAIFEKGVLTPTEPLPLAEHQRVRITIEEIATANVGGNVVPPTSPDREAAVKQFMEGVAGSQFCSTGPYPTREELYDRHADK
jgi:predicted DNA-binding antitoxin AbrB/MazE fold protein